MHRQSSLAGSGMSLALATLIAGCGGGGGGGAASSTSTSTSTGAVTNIFDQPTESSIAGNLVVPQATHVSAPVGTFGLVFLQTNPYSANGELVPTEYSVSAQTGFAPSNPSADQLGFQNVPGTSTAQMDGDTVGAYINSKDVPNSPVDPGGNNGGCGHVASAAVQKMMITPQYIWASGTAPVPFASSTSVMNGSLDLQIPTAAGDAYVVLDLLFEDPNGVRLSYGVSLFHIGVADPAVSCGYDAPGKSFKLDTPLGLDNTYLSIASGSETYTGVPWVALRHFAWSITQAQFAAALQFLAPQFPGSITDLDATQYSLTEVHLNAEINFLPGPAELGWSMSGLDLWTSN